MKLDLVSTAGKKQGTIDLPTTIFEQAINPQLMAQYIKVYRDRARQRTSSVKNRADIIGTTAKVWRQKGTGRARHGSRKAPIFVGGGQAHPPGIAPNPKRITKRAKRQVLFAALSTKASDSIAISNLDTATDKTKSMSQALSKILNWDGSQKITFVLDKPMPQLVRSIKNLTAVSATQASRLNAYEVLNSDHLVFTKESLNKLEAVYFGSSQPAAKPTPETTNKAPKEVKKS